MIELVYVTKAHQFTFIRTVVMHAHESHAIDRLQYCLCHYLLNEKRNIKLIMDNVRYCMHFIAPYHAKKALHKLKAFLLADCSLSLLLNLCHFREEMSTKSQSN
jgi:hypothetical protein